jgi:hypothetical protein
LLTTPRHYDGGGASHTGTDDDELTDFLAAYAEVCAEAGIDPLTTDALAVVAEAMIAAGVTLHRRAGASHAVLVRRRLRATR